MRAASVALFALAAVLFVTPTASCYPTDPSGSPWVESFNSYTVGSALYTCPGWTAGPFYILSSYTIHDLGGGDRCVKTNCPDSSSWHFAWTTQPLGMGSHTVQKVHARIKSFSIATLELPHAIVCTRSGSEILRWGLNTTKVRPYVCDSNFVAIYEGPSVGYSASDWHDIDLNWSTSTGEAFWFFDGIAVGYWKNSSIRRTVDNIEFHSRAHWDDNVLIDDFRAGTSTGTAPVITVQPASQSICAAGSAAFTVTAPDALLYQWMKRAVGEAFTWAPIAGATGPAYTIVSVQSSDVADYACVVTNSCFSTMTNAATLTIDTTPPTITSQPTKLVKLVGTSATFGVTATGSGLTYQWRRNGGDLSNGGHYSGVNDPTLTVSSISSSDAGLYSCLVTRACISVLSNSASLIVLTAEGSIAATKLLNDGASAKLGNKDLYLKWSGLGYIEEPNGFSGIRVQGSFTAAQGDRVCLVGTVKKPAGAEPYVQVSTMTPAGTATVRPVGATGAAIKRTLADGLWMTTWGRVKAGSITANSFVITDGSDANGLKVMTSGEPGVVEDQFVIVTGAAGFDSGRVIYRR